MQQLFEYLINDICEQKFLQEEAVLNIEEEMVNESFKCELLTNLAEQIKKAEKKNNAQKIKNNKELEEKGYGYRDTLTSFASIFGPLTINGRYSSKKGIQGLKWSEITEDDFVLIKAGNEKELKKALKPIYAKNGKGDAIICLPGTKTPVMFIKGYGKDDDKRLYYFQMNQTRWPSGAILQNSGVKEKTAPKYSYQIRSLKLDEVMPLISDLDVYILNITDELIKQYKTIQQEREEAKKGVIKKKKKSLAELLKKQKARYRALADEMKAKKLQKDPNALWDEIKKANDEVVNLYKEIISTPENIDKYYSLGLLMGYVSNAYEQFVRSMKETYTADKYDKKYPDSKDKSINREWAEEYINSAKDYVDRVNKEIEKIKEDMKKQ